MPKRPISRCSISIPTIPRPSNNSARSTPRGETPRKEPNIWKLWHRYAKKAIPKNTEKWSWNWSISMPKISTWKKLMLCSNSTQKMRTPLVKILCILQKPTLRLESQINAFSFKNFKWWAWKVNKWDLSSQQQKKKWTGYLSKSLTTSKQWPSVTSSPAKTSPTLSCNWKCIFPNAAVCWWCFSSTNTALAKWLTLPTF